MKIEAFIIHLRRAEARRPQVEELMRQLAPMPASILDAVDAQSLSEEEQARVYQRRLFKPYYPFELRPAEIACFLSHRRAWREIVDRNLDAALILEDDVGLTPGVFDAALKAGLSVCDGSPVYVQYGLRQPRGEADIVASVGAARIMQPEVGLLGTVGQLVTHPAAEKLLEATRQFDRPIDVFLQMHWRTGVRPVAAIPSGVVDMVGAVGGSTIHSRKTPSERLKREWGRFVYRHRIRSLSRRHGKRSGV